MPQNLEYKIHHSKEVDKRDMSGGEELISCVLEDENIKYTFEPRLCTEDTYTNYKGREKNYLRLTYPDFGLPEYGFFIEYVGRPDDPEYMRKLEFKMKKYEEMGIPVLYIHRDDIYNKIGEDKFKKRPDAYQNVRQLILYMTQSKKSSGTQEANIKANKFKDYSYKSDKRAA